MLTKLQVKEFYFIRYVLAFVCALCQTQMFRVLNNTLNPRIALFFMMSMIFSPGMFHASAAFLPSSFAMYATMLGMAAFMNWKGGLKTAQGIFWFAVGGILGWPFAMALSLPFLFEEIIFATLSSKDALIDVIMRFLRGIVAGLLVLVSYVQIFMRQVPNYISSSNSSYQASFIRSWLLFRSTSSFTTYSVSQVGDRRFTAPSHGISISKTYFSTSISGLSLQSPPSLFLPSKRSFPDPLKRAVL